MRCVQRMEGSRGKPSQLSLKPDPNSAAGTIWNSSCGEVLIGGSNQNMKFFSQSLSSVISAPILLLFSWNNRKRGSILKICDCPLCLRSEVGLFRGALCSSAVQLPPKSCHKLKTMTKKGCVASCRPSSSSLTCKGPALPCSSQLSMHRIQKQAEKSALSVLLSDLKEQTPEEKFCSESTLGWKEINNFILYIKPC